MRMKNTANNPIPNNTVTMNSIFAAKIINTIITYNKYPKFILLALVNGIIITQSTRRRSQRKIEMLLTENEISYKIIGVAIEV